MSHVDVSSEVKLTSSFLSPEQITTLAAAVDRIVPPDPEALGGAEGGSLAYIVRHLEDGGNLAPFRAEYLRFLQALSAENFASLSAATQDGMLTRIERSGTPSLRQFFRRFAEHAQEGYYTDPANWASLGFEVTG
jgi:hypothetical protein